MKISAIDAKFPSRVITKEETLDLIRFYSKDCYEGELKLALRVISQLLYKSGASTRYWLNKEEKPMDFIGSAVESALQKANLNKNDLDLVMYAGIGRGFIEPASAYIVSKLLGIKNAECFDILDACMSFTRALNIADIYLQSEQYNNILIVNGEFNNIKNCFLYPENYKLKNFEQIEYTFPSYTIGDAASATIVTRDTENHWRWKFKSRPDLSDLCTAPISGSESYTKDLDRASRNGEGNFCSFGNIMHEKGSIELLNLGKNFSVQDAQLIFPHASSKSAWESIAQVLGIANQMYYVYPQYGNLVSASIPSGIYLAEQEGKMNRGDKLMGWVGSAGMSFSIFSFNY